MSPERRAYLELHVAVLLFGFTAILGDLIGLSALTLVWWRVALTTFSLLFIVRVRKLWASLPVRLWRNYAGIGVLVALHWLTFYGAIKLANASIALVCMATTSFFTALLEPAILRQRVKGFEIFLGLLIIPGMTLIVQHTDWDMQWGIVVGLCSAFLAALFSTLNKKLIVHASSLDITFIELGTSWVFLSLLLPTYVWLVPEAPFWPTLRDWVYLLVLSLLCTTLAYVLALRALNYLSAFAANLTVNLEPVYGIALAWLVLREYEELDSGFYWGVVIILLAVLSYPFLRKRYEKVMG